MTTSHRVTDSLGRAHGGLVSTDLGGPKEPSNITTPQGGRRRHTIVKTHTLQPAYGRQITVVA